MVGSAKLLARKTFLFCATPAINNDWSPSTAEWNKGNQACEWISNSSYRLNFDLGKRTKSITTAGKKEHVKINKIAKFGCEML